MVWLYIAWQSWAAGCCFFAVDKDFHAMFETTRAESKKKHSDVSERTRETVFDVSCAVVVLFWPAWLIANTLIRLTDSDNSD